MSKLYKAIIVSGIRVADEDRPTQVEVEELIKAARYKPAFVFAAIYVSHHNAPLSGRQFSLVKRYTRGLKGSQS